MRLLRDKFINELKGVGFVYYIKRLEVVVVLEVMNGKILLKGYLVLFIKFVDINVRKGWVSY